MNRVTCISGLSHEGKTAELITEFIKAYQSSKFKQGSIESAMERVIYDNIIDNEVSILSSANKKDVVKTMVNEISLGLNKQLITTNYRVYFITCVDSKEHIIKRINESYFIPIGGDKIENLVFECYTREELEERLNLLVEAHDCDVFIDMPNILPGYEGNSFIGDKIVDAFPNNKCGNSMDITYTRSRNMTYTRSRKNKKIKELI